MWASQAMRRIVAIAQIERFATIRTPFIVSGQFFVSHRSPSLPCSLTAYVVSHLLTFVCPQRQYTKTSFAVTLIGSILLKNFLHFRQRSAGSKQMSLSRFIVSPFVLPLTAPGPR